MVIPARETWTRLNDTMGEEYSVNPECRKFYRIELISSTNALKRTREILEPIDEKKITRTYQSCPTYVYCLGPESNKSIVKNVEDNQRELDTE